MAPSRLGVSSASGRMIGLMATIGVSGWPCRTMSMNAESCSRNSPVLCGVRVQQLVPWLSEMTSASSSASSSAEAISPRHEPA